MEAKTAERLEARRLRAEGMAIKPIARRLGVSVSSVSVWVRDVPVPPPPPPPPPKRGAPVVEGSGKVCGRCRRELTLASFNRAGVTRQHWCRECFRAYFRHRGDVHREQSKRARDARIAPAQALVRDVLGRTPCVDCGEDEVAVLEFDHVGEKSGHVMALVWAGISVDAVQEEMARCEVVCVCCHRRRTAQRAGWARLTSVMPPLWSARHRRNHAHVRDVLTFGGCVDCGERDPVVLDFDHVGAKEARVAALTITGSFRTLVTEIAQCEVRCCNCHRLVTHARRGGSWRDTLDWVSLDDVL